MCRGGVKSSLKGVRWRDFDDGRDGFQDCAAAAVND